MFCVRAQSNARGGEGRAAVALPAHTKGRLSLALPLQSCSHHPNLCVRVTTNHRAKVSPRFTRASTSHRHHYSLPAPSSTPLTLTLLRVVNTREDVFVIVLMARRVLRQHVVELVVVDARRDHVD